jgi:hypothetical protein
MRTCNVRTRILCVNLCSGGTARVMLLGGRAHPAAKFAIVRCWLMSGE